MKNIVQKNDTPLEAAKYIYAHKGSALQTCTILYMYPESLTSIEILSKIHH
jgi:hypothetical protein